MPFIRVSVFYRIPLRFASPIARKLAFFREPFQLKMMAARLISCEKSHLAFSLCVLYHWQKKNEREENAMTLCVHKNKAFPIGVSVSIGCVDRFIVDIVSIGR